MNHMLLCFMEIVELIHGNKPLPVSSESWQRKPFTMRQLLDDVCCIDILKDDKDTIDRKIRAASYPGTQGPYIIANDNKFTLKIDSLRPIV
jgi:hypothetical protein